MTKYLKTDFGDLVGILHLYLKKKKQAEIAAKDICLKSAEIIVSSPYTGALKPLQMNLQT